MDALSGTIATAVVGGLIITAFLLGPRLVAGSIDEEGFVAPRRVLKAERVILQAVRGKSLLYAELRALASGGALVTAGLILAAVYRLAI